MSNSSYYDQLYKSLDPDWIDAPVNMVLYQEDVEEAVKAYGKRPQTALDLGCGYGAHAFSFALGKTQLDAIDINQKAIDLANDLFNHQNINFICGDYFKYDFDKTYDLVYYFRGFGDSKDREVLELIHGLVSDEGRAYIWVHNRPYWENELFDMDEYSYDHDNHFVIDEVTGDDGDKYLRKIKTYTLNQFEEMADSAGFEVEKVMLSSSLDHVNMVYLADKTIDEAKYFYALLKKK